MTLPGQDTLARLALPARWLVVAGIAYTLATAVLYFLSPPATAPVTPGATRTAAEPAPAVDVNAILSANLFGTADDTGTVAEPTAAPAVATQLPLELLGVFVADDPDNSAAIIAQRGRPGMLYSVGETLPGNATLVEVNPNHVVLRRAGMRETLHFPTTSESLAARAAPTTDFGGDDAAMLPSEDDPYGGSPEAFADEYDDGTAGGPPDESMEGIPEDMQQMVEDYQHRIEEDPNQAMEELGVEPVSEGAAEGYRVGDLAQSPYLSQTGLQPGDIILSVNGRPVGDLQQDRMELANVLAQGSARLEVQRGDRRFYVTASLPQ